MPLPNRLGACSASACCRGKGLGRRGRTAGAGPWGEGRRVRLRMCWLSRGFCAGVRGTAAAKAGNCDGRMPTTTTADSEQRRAAASGAHVPPSADRTSRPGGLHALHSSTAKLLAGQYLTALYRRLLSLSQTQGSCTGCTSPPGACAETATAIHRHVPPFCTTHTPKRPDHR